MLTAGFGYICPGPLTAGEIVGTGGVAAKADTPIARVTVAARRAVFMPRIITNRAWPALHVAEPPIPPPRLHAAHPPAERIQQDDDDEPDGVDARQSETVALGIEEEQRGHLGDGEPLRDANRDAEDVNDVEVRNVERERDAA